MGRIPAEPTGACSVVCATSLSCGANLARRRLLHQQSLQEQREVEQYFVTQGYLYPTYHFTYWMGLSTTSVNWPSFKWLDAQSRPPLTAGSSLIKPYTHWVRAGGTSCRGA